MAIGNLSKGSSVGGVLNYVIYSPEAEILEIQGFSSTTVQFDVPSMSREFDSVVASHPCVKPVLHAYLAEPPGAQPITSEQAIEGARIYLEEMGFNPEKTQYIVVMHREKDHEHFHIVANRVQLDGSLVSDKNDYRRNQAAVRVVEKTVGLTVFTKEKIKVKSIETETTKNQKTGKLETIRTAIDLELQTSKPLAEVVKSLQQQGIRVVVNQSPTTGRLSGISFSHAGKSFKGSQLGKNYSLAALTKRGLQLPVREPRPQMKQRIQSAKAERAIAAGRAAIAATAKKLDIENRRAQAVRDQKDREDRAWLAAQKKRNHEEDEEME
jgi:hypothetical protein